MSSLNPIYKILNKEYTVNFLHGINSPTITTSIVTHGSAAIAPTVTSEDYLNFNSWTTSYNSITNDTNIGALYTTVDGYTYAELNLTVITGLNVTLYLNKSDSSTLTIIWNDGTSDTTSTSSGNFNVTHNYATYGVKLVQLKITSGSGTYGFGNGSNSTAFCGGSTQELKNQLTKLYIGTNVTSIGGFALYANYSLRSISIPTGVTSIGTYAISYCYSLSGLVIPNTVTTIDTYAFSNNTSMKSIYLSNGITTINTRVLSDCYSLTTVMIPNSVTSLGQYSFYNCYSLPNITIPNSVTSIENYAFKYNYALTKVLIPSSVTNLGSYTFQSCTSLSDVDLLANITTIGMYTFASCYSISNITIPNSLITVGNYAFEKCSALSSIIIPNGITTIGYYTFNSCFALSELILPSSITTIQPGAFQLCYSITTYIILSLAPPTLANVNSFTNINQICKIYVVDERLDSDCFPTASTRYTGATNWSTYANYFYPISSHPDYGSVFFYSNGGSYCAGFYNTPGTTVVLPSPTKSGYSFIGWGTGSEVLLGGATIQIPNGALKLTANWV